MNLACKTLLFAALFIWTACSQSSSPEATKTSRPKSEYFDMAAFMAKLEKGSQGHALRKLTVSEEDLQEGVVERPDYKKELALFYAADLTKPAWQGAFSVNSQGQTVTYIAKTAKPELRLLALERDSSQKIRRISISLVQSNYLYDSEASGVLYVRYQDTIPMLDSVSVSGQQKIILGTPFTYVLQGKLL